MNEFGVRPFGLVRLSRRWQSPLSSANSEATGADVSVLQGSNGDRSPNSFAGQEPVRPIADSDHFASRGMFVAHD